MSNYTVPYGIFHLTLLDIPSSLRISLNNMRGGGGGGGGGGLLNKQNPLSMIKVIY